MKNHRALYVVTLMFVVCMLAGDAKGQIPPIPPPHPPGTICFTPRFWCWAQPPGPPNTSCGCPSPQGWVQGVRG